MTQQPTPSKKFKYTPPEGYLQVKNHKDIFVDSQGTFFNTRTGHSSKGYCYPNNIAVFTYYQGNGNYGSISVARAIADLFLPVPEEFCKPNTLTRAVGFIDNDFKNVKLGNLKWTRSKNCKRLKITDLKTGMATIYESVVEAHKAVSPHTTYDSFRLLVAKEIAPRKKLSFEYV